MNAIDLALALLEGIKNNTFEPDQAVYFKHGDDSESTNWKKAEGIGGLDNNTPYPGSAIITLQE